MNGERDEPLYVISIVARMVGVHAQTLRYYEKAGLIEPSRSEGNRRYYSQHDLERIRHTKALVDEMGVNLAGAEVALRLMTRIQEMEEELQQMRMEVRMLRSRAQRPALEERRRPPEA